MAQVPDTASQPADNTPGHQHLEEERSQTLWPSPDYNRQIEQLRAAIGETIFLVELSDSPVQLGVRLTAKPYVLLGLIDFPRPDPTRGLAPHLLLLDDGRGVNLGRIARVSRRPFAPQPTALLYQDRAAEQNLLFAKRRLSREFLGVRSRVALGECLGYSPPEVSRLTIGPGDQET